MITYTIRGKPVNEETIAKRFSSVAFVKDYRLEQLDTASYRIMILPDLKAASPATATTPASLPTLCSPTPCSVLKALKGAVLDALVDVYGLKGHFDIDIITEDEELLPPADTVQKVRRVM